MAVEVVVPEVGEAGMDVTFVRWLKEEGDSVAVGEILFELDTEKTVVEVEAWATGTLVDRTVSAGDVVSPRQVIGCILAPGEAPAGGRPSITTTAGSAPGAESSFPGPEAAPDDVATPDSRQPAGSAPTGGASPRARRLARDRGINLASVIGTGPDGIVTERDVLSALGEDAT